LLLVNFNKNIFFGNIVELQYAAKKSITTQLIVQTTQQKPKPATNARAKSEAKTATNSKKEYYEKNKEKLLKQKQEQYKNMPTEKKSQLLEKVKQQAKAYYEQHKPEVLQKRKAKAALVKQLLAEHKGKASALETLGKASKTEHPMTNRIMAFI